MPVIDALIASLEAEAPVLDVRVGLRWTAVVVDKDSVRACGIAATIQRTPEHTITPPMPQAGTLHTHSALTLAGWIHSDNPLEAGVGMAAINALLDVDMAACTDRNAGDVILAHGAGKRVVIVGHFPFIPDLRTIAREVWVLEQRPKDGDLPAERAPDMIPHADVVGITGQTLANHTYDDLIALCRPDALVVVLGGSTPLSPVLLAHGAHVVAGTRIVDIDAALVAIGQGAGFRQIPGKRLLTLERPAPGG